MAGPAYLTLVIDRASVLPAHYIPAPFSVYTDQSHTWDCTRNFAHNFIAWQNHGMSHNFASVAQLLFQIQKSSILRNFLTRMPCTLILVNSC